MESGWNIWVWLVGVVSRRWVWLVGGMWFECIGVVSGCCCKEVYLGIYRFPHNITYMYVSILHLY